MTKPNWSKDGGLLPAIVQDVTTGQVLMLGYMNEEAWNQTHKTKLVTFFSRSKNRIWVKGETSKNVLEFVEGIQDCDRDALLILARPKGPTCHTGTKACFGEANPTQVGFLPYLEEVIEERKRNPTDSSYTAKLFQEGLDKIAQKVGEEAVEVVIASKNEDSEALTEEVADLLYHLMVLLRAKDLPLAVVMDFLKKRHPASPE